MEETASISRLRSIEADMVGKPDRRLPWVHLLHLHAWQCRLKVAPEQKRIRNRGSGEENSG